MSPLGTSEIWNAFLEDEGGAVRQFARNDAISPGALFAAALDYDERFICERLFEDVGGVTWEYCIVDGRAAVTACLGEHFDLKVPERLGGLEVAFIGPRCFANQRLLYEISVPSTVEEVCDYAFMFSGLTAFTAPASLRRIGTRAFFRCWQLAEVGLGERLAEIGDEAFCLTAIDALAIPQSVRRIGRDALSNSPLARSAGHAALLIEEGSPYFVDERGALYKRGDRGISLIGFMNTQDESYCVLDGTVTVAGKAFARNKTLRSVCLPEGVCVIQDAAFSGCRNLEHVALPSTLEVIGKAAFKNCRINTLRLPRALREIGEDAFAVKNNDIYCESTIRRIDVDEGNAAFYTEGGMLCRRGEGGGTVVLYFGHGGTVVIPADVTRIGSNAFMAKGNVSRLVLHSHVREVAERGFAFKGGVAEEVYLGAAPDGSDVTVRFPPCTAGVAAARSCFAPGDVDAQRAQFYADNALMREEDRSVRLSLMCRRLAEPLWLSKEHERAYYNELAEFIEEACAVLARGSFLEGYQLLASCGLLTQERFATVLEAVSATGEAKAVTQLLALRHRLWDADQLDFDL